MSEADYDKDILPPGEVEFYVKTLEPSKIEDIASLAWFEFHHRLQKLGQQASVEAGQMRAEMVKEHFASYEKVPLLIHEAICIQIWREKVFKEILKIKKDPPNTFIAYIILYHEITAVGLLQNLMYHKEVVETLGDTVLDLIDYCGGEMVRLLSMDTTKEEKPVLEMTNLEELESQSRTIGFNIALSCICIMSYIVRYLDNLPLSATNRVYTTHDMPLLFTNLLQTQPWKKLNEKSNTTQVYEEGSWKNVEKLSGIPKVEGQCWLALRVLLLDPRCSAHYEMNEFRKQHLIKVQRHLHETVIDQISPLIDLKQYLLQLQVSNPPSSTKRPLLMETIPEIRTNIINQGLKKWKRIAKKHIDIIYDTNKEMALQVAKRLGETYDVDHLEKLNPEGPICSGCGDQGVKRCSRCKSEWYCGRECQVKRWPKHKSACSLVSEAGDASST